MASSNDVLNDLLSFYVDKSVIKLYCNLYFFFFHLNCKPDDHFFFLPFFCVCDVSG